MNLCRFCSRPDAVSGKPNIYETKTGVSLYLHKAPSAEEVVIEIESRSSPSTREIAFVGLGEPLLQFKLVTDVMTRIRERAYKGKIRIDTNGLVKCWHKGNPARVLRKAGIDEARISVNAVSDEEYRKLCRPAYKEAFKNLCAFVHECISEGIDTKASFVTDFDDGEIRSRSADDYTEFAVTLGIMPESIILRKYIAPLSK